MRINNREEDHITIDNTGAELAMEACMGTIHEILLEPALKSNQLSEQDFELFSVIGNTLRLISAKAQAYEDAFENGTLPKNYQN